MRAFPILWPYDRAAIAAYEIAGCPRYVAWSALESHEEQAKRNHGQTLEELAARGGLSPREAVAVLTDRRWAEVARMPEDVAILELLRLVLGPTGSREASRSPPSE